MRSAPSYPAFGECPSQAGRRGRRLSASSGFTVAEVVVSTCLVAILFLAAMTFYTGGQKDLAALQESLEINANTLKAFTWFSRDLRGANMVLYPPPTGYRPTPPVFRPGRSRGSNSRLVLLQETISLRQGRIQTAATIIDYYLDKPVEVGVDDRGRRIVTYSLFKRVNGQPEPPSEKPILTGIRELVFYRFIPLPGTRQGPPPPVRVSPREVRIRMQSVRKRIVRGKVKTAYGAVLDTSVHVRGRRG